MTGKLQMHDTTVNPFIINNLGANQKIFSNGSENSRESKRDPIEVDGHPAAEGIHGRNVSVPMFHDFGRAVRGCFNRPSLNSMGWGSL